MIESRRRTTYSAKKAEYITDGLVFELNAAKGLSEDGWIEQVSGKKFTWTEGSDKVFSPLGVEIGSAVGTNGSSMECENSTFGFLANSCSIEVTMRWITGETSKVVFNLGMKGGFALSMETKNRYLVGVKGSCTMCWPSGGDYTSRLYVYLKDKKLYINGVYNAGTRYYGNRGTVCSIGSMAMLGSNADGTYPCSKVIIRAIRIYNRPLTDEEIAHNYDLDTKIFNL